MGLYGLDFVIDKDELISDKEKPLLAEINGICSGMRGFEKIYGDKRVKNKVYSILENKFGKLTVNNESAFRKRRKKENLFKFLWDYKISKLLINQEKKLKKLKELIREDENLHYRLRDAPNSHKLKLPFEDYVGQDSVVFNILNQEIEHPSINSRVAEAITRNKFLQYELLRDSEISDFLMQSTFVESGITHEEELKEMLNKYDSFIIKPISCSSGIGINILSNQEVRNKYKNTRGMVAPRSLFYIEDKVKEEDFNFEVSLKILQPFINSKEEDHYVSIRAIVCEGQLIDAYKRKSNNCIVNLSQDAIVEKFDYDDSFKKTCENIVNVYENCSKAYTYENFKKQIYNKFFERRGFTSKEQRNLDHDKNLVKLAANLFQ